MKELYERLGQLVVQGIMLGTIQMTDKGMIGDVLQKIAAEMNKPKVEDTK